MIYTIGGIKGGSGKTTVAVSLAILLSQSDRKVLLVDADDQKSATDFTALRNEDREGGAGYTAVQLADKAVRTEIRQLAPNYDDIVIDTGGRDTTSQRAALSGSARGLPSRNYRAPETMPRRSHSLPCCSGGFARSLRPHLAV